MTNAQNLLKRLLTILKRREISDNGREFRPTFITSCRVKDVQDLEVLFKEIEQEVMQAELLDQFGQGGRKFTQGD